MAEAHKKQQQQLPSATVDSLLSPEATAAAISAASTASAAAAATTASTGAIGKRFGGGGFRSISILEEEEEEDEEEIEEVEPDAIGRGGGGGAGAGAEEEDVYSTMIAVPPLCFGDDDDVVVVSGRPMSRHSSASSLADKAADLAALIDVSTLAAGLKGFYVRIIVQILDLQFD